MGGEKCAGQLLPLTQAEHDWPRPLRGILYAVGMVYCFIGVSIIADIFMAAIEEVTSRKKVKMEEKGTKRRTHSVWNETVANLSLMALGSSAPEIAISLVELLRNGFYSGELGSSTIVGSAAFNLFTIVAVCVMSIPNGETRVIHGLNVFYVTAIFSMFAYLWLVFVLAVTSPDVVEIWEALATLLFLPILIGISYYVDVHGAPEAFETMVKTLSSKHPIQKEAGKDKDKGKKPHASNDTKHLKESLRSSHIRDAVEQQGMSGVSSCVGAVGGGHGFSGVGPRRSLAHSGSHGIADRASNRRRSLMSRRSFCDADGQRASRALVRQGSSESSHISGGSPASSMTKLVSLQLSGSDVDDTVTSTSQVQFLVNRQMLSNGTAVKSIILYRSGILEHNVEVTYTVHVAKDPPEETFTALLGFKYEKTKPKVGKEVLRQKAIMPAGDRYFTIEVPAPEQWDQTFVVVLQSVSLEGAGGIAVDVEGEESKDVPTVAPGNMRWTWVIRAPECPGYLRFLTDTEREPTHEALFVKGSEEEQEVEVVVHREEGCTGKVSCTYRTEKFTAVEDQDFVPADDALCFPEGTTERVITLRLPGRSLDRVADEFFVILQDGSDSIKFCEDHDGGEDEAILSVKISEVDATHGSLVKKLDRVFNISNLHKGLADWSEQFSNLRYVGGDEEEHADASNKDWFFHILTFPWQLIFATVPPTPFLGGWLCFYVALLWIGAITAIVADFAELFGCVFHVPDMVTAITFVALGTSMPDLFASLTAATEDPTADASIVNVTGSNSVNVFLGLGLPWTLAAIFWASKDSDGAWAEMYGKDFGSSPVFVVPSQNLGFSVILFCVCCLSAFFTLIMRRREIECELGGPQHIKYATGGSFISLWLLYVAVASWWALREATAPLVEKVLVLVLAAVIFIVATAVPVVLLKLWQGDDPKPKQEQDSFLPAAGGPLAPIKDNMADDTDGDNHGCSWRDCLDDISKEWERVLATLSASNEAVRPALERARNDLEQAAQKDDTASVAAAQAAALQSFHPAFARIADLSEDAASKALAALAAKLPAPKAGDLASLRPALELLRRLLACEGPEQLAQVLQADAQELQCWDDVAKVVLVERCRAWGAPAKVIQEVAADGTNCGDMPASILAIDGAHALQTLVKVAQEVGADVPELLRSVCSNSLLRWGLVPEHNGALLEPLLRALQSDAEGGADGSAAASVALACRSSVTEWIGLCGALGLKPVEAFVRPALTAHFVALGLDEREFMPLRDRLVDAIEDEKVRGTVNDVVRSRAQAAVASAGGSLGMPLGAPALRSLLRSTLVDLGISEGDTWALLRDASEEALRSALEALSSGFAGGMSVAALQDALSRLGAKSSVAKMVLRGRLSAWGASEECLQCVDSAVASVRPVASEPLERCLLQNGRRLEDLRLVLNSAGVEEQDALLQSVAVARLVQWRLPPKNASELAAKFLVEELHGAFSRVFLEGCGAAADFRELSSFATPGGDAERSRALWIPLLGQGCVRCGLSIQQAKVVMDQVSDNLADPFEDEAVRSIVAGVVAGGRPTAAQWQALCEAVDGLDFQDLFEAASETFYTERLGLAEHHAGGFAEQTVEGLDAEEAAAAFSAVLLNGEVTVGALAALPPGRSADVMESVFRPIFVKVLCSWGLLEQEAMEVASKLTSIEGVEDLFDRGVLAKRPELPALQALCGSMDVACTARVLQPALRGYLVHRGVPRPHAESIAGAAFGGDDGREADLLQDGQFGGLDALCGAVSMRAVEDVVLPSLLSRLTSLGLEDSAAQELACRTLEVGRTQQALGFVQRAVLGRQARFADLLALGDAVGVDAYKFLLKPMVTLRAMRWGVATAAAEAAAAEAVRLATAGSAHEVLARSVLGPDAPDPSVKLEFLAVLHIDHKKIGAEQPELMPELDAPAEELVLQAALPSPKRAAAKKKRIVKGSPAHKGDEGEAVSSGKPKKSTTRKKRTSRLVLEDPPDAA